MSESPERKVLKETISKLKSKNINSLDNYKMNVKAFNDTISIILNSMQNSYSGLKPEDQKQMAILFLLLGTVVQEFKQLLNSSFNAFDDMQLYVSTLESYSVELDNTLTAIFTQAKKYAEEKTKEQEALMKRPDTSYVK